VTAIRTRKPTGAVPWPLILIEGPEKSGKSWAAAEFTACERIGQTYWLDLGEGSADEYSAIPGANYLVLKHDGTWGQILDQTLAVKAEAARAAEAGEPPVVLVIDSMTAEWELLKDWVSSRARRSKAGRAALQRDPSAEVKPAMNLWSDAGARHHQLMTTLMTFPGIVIMTARGKDVVAMDDNGQPKQGARDYKVEGQKSLAYDATAWVRLSRDTAPQVVGVRSVHTGLRPGVDQPKPWVDFTLEALIFDVLKCIPADAHVREVQQLDGGEAPADDIRDRVLAADTEKALKELWEQAKAARLGDADVCDRAGDSLRLRDFITQELTMLRAQAAEKAEVAA